MNRKLGTLIKAALFALPLALPGVALAQSADQPTSTGTYDNADKQNAPMQDKSNIDKTTPQPESGSTGVTPDSARTPPPSDNNLDTSGSTKSAEPGVGSDINKSPENMNSDTSTTTRTTKIKKHVKKSSSSGSDLDNSNDLNKDNSNDLNK